MPTSEKPASPYAAEKKIFYLVATIVMLGFIGVLAGEKSMTLVDKIFGGLVCVICLFGGLTVMSTLPGSAEEIAEAEKNAPEPD